MTRNRKSDFPVLDGVKVVAIDTETTGLDLHRGAKVFGVSIATSSGHKCYWDIREQPRALEYLRKELWKVPTKVFHNAQFDLTGLRGAGIELDLTTVHDTMVRACLINENLYEYSLDSLAQKYLGRTKTTAIYEEMAAKFGGKATRQAQMGNLQHMPSDRVATYAVPDADLTLELFCRQNILIGQEGIEEITAFEQRLLPVTLSMALRGVAVDCEAAEKEIKRLNKLRDQLQRDLDKMAGRPVNFNPSKSLTELIAPAKGKDGRWYAKDGTPLKVTEGGKPQLDKKALMRMKMPEAKMVLQLRKIGRVVDVFLTGHVLGSQVNGRVFPTINQNRGEDGGTKTGRFSYADPALQQMSARDEDAAESVRSAFVPYEEGDVWVCRDYKQSDFRVMAHLSKEPRLIDAYTADPDADFHGTTAELTGIPRNPPYAGAPNSKQINLGLIFGMGDGKLAAEMGMPYHIEEGYKGKQFLKAGPEAMAVFEKYHASLPGIKTFLKYATNMAKSRKYVWSLARRKLRFPNRNDSYKAAGYLFQAGTADIIKKGLIDMYYREDSPVNTHGAQIIMTVHDELSLSVRKKDAKYVNDKASEIMCQVYNLRVPLRTDGGIGKNWYDAK